MGQHGLAWFLAVSKPHVVRTRSTTYELMCMLHGANLLNFVLSALYDCNVASFGFWAPDMLLCRPSLSIVQEHGVYLGIQGRHQWQSAHRFHRITKSTRGQQGCNLLARVQFSGGFGV